jgi:glycosyltransferase involved in cell wall biosynthesis
MLVLWWITFSFLLLRFMVATVNYWYPQRLEDSTAEPGDKVSILIPARNEEKNIDKLLRSILNQDYKNYEVLVLDDHSTDRTAMLVQQFSKIDPKVKLLKGDALPPNMLGKNWACHQLALQSKGNKLLFLDADVTVKKGLIKNALAYSASEKLTLLSIFPDQLMETRGEKLVVPLMHYLLLSMLPLVLIRKSSFPSLAAANGQFMLFDAGTYKKHLFHLSLANKITEDIECMKLVKKLGYRGQTLLANGFIQCRMYKSYQDGINGFSKNILSGFGNSVSALLVYLALTTFSYIAFIWFVPTPNLWLSFILIIYLRIMISKAANQNLIFNVLYHSWQMLTLVHISVLSVNKLLTKSNEWKGRTINQ